MEPNFLFRFSCSKFLVVNFLVGLYFYSFYTVKLVLLNNIKIKIKLFILGLECFINFKKYLKTKTKILKWKCI